MKIVARTAAVAIGATVLGLAATQPASANTFKQVSVVDGTISYFDGLDKFCAKAYNGGHRQVHVHLTAISRPGPTKDFTDVSDAYGSSYAGATCVSLKYAYEDTRYKAVITTWNPAQGSVSRGSKLFYS